MSSSGASESEVETCDENAGLLGTRATKSKHEKSKSEETAPLHRPLGSNIDDAIVEFGGGRHDYNDPYTSDDDLLPNGSDAYGSTVGATISLKFNEACRAIRNGHYPERIAQGSSGRNHRSFQAKERGAIRIAESKMAKMVAPRVSSMLLWS
uniref:Uncharacterized protein n=1 Tax=Caenorhabditis japonica TaxID=281687 RepID=A0A8R1DL76_CAEJA